MKNILLIIGIIKFTLAYAQITNITGIIRDKNNQEPLPFVQIIGVGTNCGCISNIEGKFNLTCNKPFSEIKITCVGYESAIISVNNNNSLKVNLIPLDKMLEEVTVLPGINPADVIMKNVYENRNKHNPEKAVSFRYMNYNKLYFTAQLDSSIANNPEKFAKLDTGSQKAARFLDKQYIFLTESITERKYLLNAKKNKETVLASRVSGFKNPIFSLLATQLQSFTFYNDFISLGSVEYHGIISKNATEKYLFLIQDTLVKANNDTTIRITFRPFKNKAFKGMQGSVWINKTDYAIEQVIAEPYDDMSKSGLHIKINQLYDKIDQTQWFPVQLNSRIYFKSITIQSPDFSPYGVCNSYIKNIKINPPLKRNEFNEVEIESDENIASQTESFWNTWREDSLNKKEEQTYRVIDSISETEKLEKKIDRLSSILNGKIPLGYFTLDLDKLLNYNDYEGLRLGLGIGTSRKLSKHFVTGLYGAYGFKDKTFKYGGEMNINFSKRRQAGMQIFYKNDIIADGNVLFALYKQPMLNNNDFSALFINRFNRIEKYGVLFYMRAIKYFRFYGGLHRQRMQLFNDYYYTLPVNDYTSLHIDNFTNYEATVGFRFQYREKFMLTSDGLISLGSKFPVVWFSYTFSRKENNFSPFSYDKFDLRIDKINRIKGFGYFSYRLNAGMLSGSVPLAFHYNLAGTYRHIKNLSVYAGNSFETMRTNEFYASNYVALHLKLETTALFYGKVFRPQFALMHNIFVGNFLDINNHQNVSFNVAKNPFIESGVAINNIIKSKFSGFGLSAFYRYGYHQLPKSLDNFAFKITLSFILPD
jgi:hypothetical protein